MTATFSTSRTCFRLQSALVIENGPVRECLILKLMSSLEPKGLGSNPNSAVECEPEDTLILMMNGKHCKTEEGQNTHPSGRATSIS